MDSAKKKLPFVRVAAHPTTPTLVFCYGNNLQVFSVASGKFVHSCAAHSDLVRVACFRGDGKHLATAGDDRVLKLWDTSTWNCLGEATTPKKVTAVVFHEEKIFFADRFGDVSSINIASLTSADCQFSLGHTSYITDMVLSRDHKYLLTADRDYKIRVSSFPQTFCIHSFCLGHTSFVTRLLLPHLTIAANAVISGSADGTLRLWNMETGLCLASLVVDNRPAPVTPVACCSVRGVFGVLKKGLPEVNIYSIEEQAEIRFLPLQVLETSWQPIDATFDSKGQLWVVGGSAPLVQTFVYDQESSSYVRSLPPPSLNADGSENVSAEKIDEVLFEYSMDHPRLSGSKHPRDQGPEEAGPKVNKKVYVGGSNEQPQPASV